MKFLMSTNGQSKFWMLLLTVFLVQSALACGIGELIRRFLKK